MNTGKQRKAISLILGSICIVVTLFFWPGKDPAIEYEEDRKEQQEISRAETEVLVQNVVLKAQDGSNIKLRNICNDGAVCLLFWMPWSRESDGELQLLQEMEQKYGKQIHFAAISFPESGNRKEKERTESRSFSFPLYMMRLEDSRKLSVYSVPKWIVVSRYGRLIWQQDGVADKAILEEKLVRAESFI